MMGKLFALVVLALALPAEAGANWSSLWRNADQQGEALMRHGDAAAAARTYRDPRRKAYAELKAGNYAAAARDLAAIDESDADYNRGNALAHGGDLQGALRAYDAALKRDPHNRDARHNRELVARALKQNAPQQQGSGGDKGQDGKPGGKNSSGQGAASPSPEKQGEAAKPGTSGQNGQQGQPASANPPQAGQKNASPGTEQRSGGNESAQKGLQQKNTQDKTNAAPQSSAAPQDDKGNDAEQARRDAAESVNKSAAGKPGGTGADDTAGVGKAQTAPPLPSEKQLAQTQWLRSIPDDPGGLLRRKFLIEHLMRKQNTQP